MHIDEDKKFDKRTIERNLRQGDLPAKEWEQFLKKLPDVSDKMDFVIFEEAQEEETIEDKKARSKKSVGEETTPEKE